MDVSGSIFVSRDIKWLNQDAVTGDIKWFYQEVVTRDINIKI